MEAMLLLTALILVFLSPLIIFLIIWFKLAPRNYFFTFVDEGSAKIIVKGGEVSKILIQYKGHTLDENYNVIPGKEYHLFGGLRYYGFWPINNVYIYAFQWSGVRENGEIVNHPKEIMDYILLKDDIYWTKVENAEDKELVPLDIEVILTIRVVNPYKALFKIQNWLEATINQIKPVIRQIITEKSYEEWIAEKKYLGETILKEGKDIIDSVKDNYGVEILKIQIKDIDPVPVDTLTGIRAATIKRYLAKKEKERIEIGAEAEAERIRTIYNAIEEGKEYIRTLEALEKSTNKFIFFPIPLPTDMFEKFFPNRDKDKS